MTRTSLRLVPILTVLALAIGAGPAAADEYRSPDSIVGLGGSGEPATPVEVQATTDAKPLFAGADSTPPSFAGGGYRSPDSILAAAPPEPSPSAVIAAPASDGFDWAAAFVGGLLGALLCLAGMVAARFLLRNHRRVAVESHV